MKFECIYDDQDESCWIIGEWQYLKNKKTGEGKWDHLSAFSEKEFCWRDASPFAEENAPAES